MGLIRWFFGMRSQKPWRRYPGTFPSRCDVDGAALSSKTESEAVYQCGHKLAWEFTPVESNQAP